MDLSIQVGANAVLCAGDLYEHDRFTPDTAAFLKSTFERIHPMRVFIAPGNHDWYGPQSLYRQVEWSDNVHIFETQELRPVALDGGVTLWGAAHGAPADTTGFLDSFEVHGDGIHLALFHGSERAWFAEQGGSKVLHAPFDARKIVESGLTHAFLGHYHRPRDDRQFTYPGNPDPLAFGEDGVRGAIVATVNDDGAIARNRRDVSMTQAHDLTVDISASASQQDIRDHISLALDRIAGASPNPIYRCVRMTLCGELSPDVEFRPQELAGFWQGFDYVGVRVGELHIAYDLQLICEESTVRGEFVRDVLSQDISEEDKRRTIETGLRALEGRDDLEVS
jgi:exonuclease SbcD